jgi:hypothetical protein
MQTLFAPLFKPFAIIHFPIRYFILLLFTILGGFHLAYDIYGWYLGHEFMGTTKVVSLSLLLTVVVFISQYLKQKSLKQTSSKTNTP